MQITKKNVVTSGEWSDEQYTGSLYSGPELDGFWVECTFSAHSKDGYIKNVAFGKWESGYIDKEDNTECQLSESMDNLLESRVIFYIKNAVI